MNSAQLFGKKFIEEQKHKLLTLKEELLGHMRSVDKEELMVVPEEGLEDGDIATQTLIQNVSIGLRSRDLERLREIEYALERIEQGTYGICEDTEEPIEKRRLEKMPWARLSLEAQAERENSLDFGRAA